MSTKRQTILSLLIPAIVAIIPATYTYCQSMYEVRQKYNQSHKEAEAGYASLVTSVKELQDATKEQHDQLIKIQAYLSAMEQYFSRTASLRSSGGAGYGSAAGVRALSVPDPRTELARARPAAPAAPDLTEPAASFDQAAQAKR